MAGNKETPRQRMIGMMYLVLTALLALNVSKEIVNAFVKLNDKIEDANAIVEMQIETDLDKFKLAMADKSARVVVKQWYDKAKAIHDASNMEFDFFLKETNSLLKATEGEKSEWLEKDKNTGRLKLKSLMAVEAKDDYDAATRLFVGDNPTSPNERGRDLRTRLEKLRDMMVMQMANYTLNNKTYSINEKLLAKFDPKIPSTRKYLKEAMVNCNKLDTAAMNRVIHILSYPQQLNEFDEVTSWQGSMFNYSPVVAASAMLTALRSDIRTAESIAIQHLFAKVDVNIIHVNKIEPVAFAPKGYLNVGDTMPLKVMIAAYDSNSVSMIRYADNPEMSNQEEKSGMISIKATTPGVKNLYGNIAVKEKGVITWKPWTFQYEVGQPQAVISATDLNVLYIGHENKISASASGYSSNEVRLTGDGVTIQPSNGNYVVKVPASMVGRRVMLHVTANGKRIGSTEFRIKNIPKPMTFLGAIPATESTITRSQLLTSVNSGVRLGYDDSSPISVNFRTSSYKAKVEFGGSVQTLECTNGKFSPKDLRTLQNLRPGTVLRIEEVRGLAGTLAIRGVPMNLTVR